MDGSHALAQDDLPGWDLAFTNPTLYAQQYPGLNRIFGGDLTHDGNLTLLDRAILTSIINSNLPGEPNEPEDLISAVPVLTPRRGDHAGAHVRCSRSND